MPCIGYKFGWNGKTLQDITLCSDETIRGPLTVLDQPVVGELPVQVLAERVENGLVPGYDIVGRVARDRSP